MNYPSTMLRYCPMPQLAFVYTKLGRPNLPVKELIGKCCGQLRALTLKVAELPVFYLGQDDGADIPNALGVLLNRPVAAELGGTGCIEDRHPCP